MVMNGKSLFILYFIQYFTVISTNFHNTNFYIYIKPTSKKKRKRKKLHWLDFEILNVNFSYTTMLAYMWFICVCVCVACGSCGSAAGAHHLHSQFCFLVPLWLAFISPLSSDWPLSLKPALIGRSWRLTAMEHK